MDSLENGAGGSSAAGALPRAVALPWIRTDPLCFSSVSHGFAEPPAHAEVPVDNYPLALMTLGFWDVGTWGADVVEHITRSAVIVAPGVKRSAFGGKSNRNGVEPGVNVGSRRPMPPRCLACWKLLRGRVRFRAADHSSWRRRRSGVLVLSLHSEQRSRLLVDKSREMEVLRFAGFAARRDHYVRRAQPPAERRLVCPFFLCAVKLEDVSWKGCQPSSETAAWWSVYCIPDTLLICSAG